MIQKLFSQRRIGRSTLILIVLNVFLNFVISLRSSIYLPTYHLDGAFQTASGLYRIKWGEIPGIDFFPYLGIGPLISLAPLFLAFGGNLWASVVAANVVTLGVMQISAAIVFVLSTKSSIRNALVFSLIPLFLTYGTDMGTSSLMNFLKFLGVDALFELSNPGNSLRPLRSFAAWLLPVIIFLILRLRGTQLKWHFTIGLIAGFTLCIWSNDYAITTSFLGVVLYLVLIQSGIQDKLTKFVMAFSGFLTSTLISVLTLLIEGWNSSFLKYNFVDVRGDQYWYFGPWDEVFRVNSFLDLYNQLLSERVQVSLLILTGIVLYAFYKKSKEFLVISFIGFGLFLGGMTSTIGGHSYIYFSPFRLWGALVILSLLTYIALSFSFQIKYKSKNINFHSLQALGLVVILFVVSQTNLTLRKYQEAHQNTSVAFNYELGGYFPKDYVPLETVTRSKLILEEYWGIASTNRQMKRTSKTDSVIHALGSQREQFISDLGEEELIVVTSSPSVGEWFNWNMSANWWFYGELLRNFTPEQNSPITLQWSRSKSPALWKKAQCLVSANGQSVSVNSPRTSILEVSVDYINPGRYSREFTMIQNNLNFAAGANGFLALDPGASTQKFPVAVIPGMNTLKLRHIGGTKKFVSRLISCSANEIDFPKNSERFRLLNSLIEPTNTPFNLTDSNWVKGVANFDTAFFVLNSPSNSSNLRVGSRLVFSNGESRQIQRIESAGQYLNIFLDGEKLTPEVYGFPNKFKVIDSAE
jgi:hypothetical protein